MKRILSLLLALAILITLLPQLTLPVNAATASGTCGDHLTWTLSGDTLTVSGEGPMYDYSAGSTWAPWWKYAEDITCIVIENGVTTIGNFAFWQNLYHVNSITIPDSVTYIGESAMCNFPFIRESKTFTIPAGVQSVAPQFLDSGFVEKIEVDPNNPYLCAVDGVLYNKDQTILYYCPPRKNICYYSRYCHYDQG